MINNLSKNSLNGVNSLRVVNDEEEIEFFSSAAHIHFQIDGFFIIVIFDLDSGFEVQVKVISGFQSLIRT